jgi:peptide/nickel transport system substrate-binding protein
VRATDPARRKHFADEIQRLALDEVTFVPWGQWVLPTAYRKNVQGVLLLPAPLFWNVSIT